MTWGSSQRYVYTHEQMRVGRASVDLAACMGQIFSLSVSVGGEYKKVCSVSKSSRIISISPIFWWITAKPSRDLQFEYVCDHF